MHSNTQLKRPVYITFGDIKIKLGYQGLGSDGSEMWIAPFPNLGLHVSFHPSGLIKISDNTGFSRYIRIDDWDLCQIDPEYYLEMLLSRIDNSLEPLGEAIAIIPQVDYPQHPKYTKYGIEYDILETMQWMKKNGPFWKIEEQDVPLFLNDKSVDGAFLIFPELEQFAMVTDKKRSILTFNYGDKFFPELVGTVDYIPSFNRFGSVFKEVFEHINDLSQEGRYGIPEHFQSQINLRKIDSTIKKISFVLEDLEEPWKLFKDYSPE